MYIIQANCHVLFELTQKLALKVGFPLPRPISDPGGFVSKCLLRLLAWGWAVCSNSDRVGRQQPERHTVKNVFLRRLGRWPTSQSRLLFSQQCKKMPAVALGSQELLCGCAGLFCPQHWKLLMTALGLSHSVSAGFDDGGCYIVFALSRAIPKVHAGRVPKLMMLFYPPLLLPVCCLFFSFTRYVLNKPSHSKLEGRCRQ